MTKWTVTMAMALAGVMAAGPAFAQATTGSAPASGSETKGEQPKGTPAPPDSAGQPPRATNDSSTSGAMKSDTGTMKSHSGHMRSSRTHKGGMAGHMDQERVKAAQQALKDKGHDPGSVDGRMGPRTHHAVRDFQKAQGLQVTGRLDAKTMQSLGVETHMGSAGSSSTSGSASPGASTRSSSGQKY